MDVLAVALFPYIVHYMRKSVVFLCGCFLGQVHVRIRGSICVWVGGILWPLGACGGGVLWLVWFEKRIPNTMQILQLQNKGTHLNTIERFYIYAEYTKDNHLNDDSTVSPNKIFDTPLKPHQP